ncbi:MAG: hypothetical protein S4CHLAM37_01340 [Chlamydiia bacterium]|nr:hypothetical protein [Chlamydiia bacterium]
MTTKTATAPAAYIWRRVHSIFGLLIVFFLIEHIITNSQSALLFGENGEGYIRAVNFIKNLPYLPFIEVFIIGIPILVHMVLGIMYMTKAKVNASLTDKAKPSLGKFARNQAFMWQRISGAVLVVGILLHVGYMRFYKYPTQARVQDKEYYFTRLNVDNGLYTVAARLGVKLYDSERVEEQKQSLLDFERRGLALEKEADAIYDKSSGLKSIEPVAFSSGKQKLLDEAQIYREKKAFVKALTKRSIKKNQVIAEADNFGTSTLFMVRDSFKSPIKGVLYTIFVLAAAFHAFNGLWTFCITWGFVIRMRSQKTLVNICTAAMVLIVFLGLASVWGTYWLNLPR